MRIFQKNMHTLIGSFLRNEKGATAIEYVVIAALLSVAIAASVTAIGVALDVDYFQPLVGIF